MTTNKERSAAPNVLKPVDASAHESIIETLDSIDNTAITGWIVTGTSGHVWLAESISFTQDGWVAMNQARIVRVWGTTGYGLNYIATHGPTSKTELDQKTDLILLSSQQVHNIIPCTAPSVAEQ